MSNETDSVPDYGGADERDERDEMAAPSASEDGKRSLINEETDAARRPQLPSDAWGERAANQLDQARLVLRAARRLVLAAAGVVVAVLFLITVLAPL
jgi:hypothetical protein